MVECRGSPSAMKLVEMDRHRIVGRWRARLVADLLDVLRPFDRKGLFAPYAFEQRAIRPLRGAVDRTGAVGQAHFDWIGWRALRLFGGRVAQSAAGGAHVPEIAADEVALAGIVMQDGCKRRLGGRLRLAVAKTGAHPPRIGSGCPVEFRYRAGESRLGPVGESASLIWVHR